MKQKIIIGAMLANGAALLLLAVGFWLRFWPLELIVSLTPQLLLLSGLHIFLFFGWFRRPRPRRWHPWHKWWTWGVAGMVLLTGFCLLYSLEVQRPARLTVAQAPTIRVATFNRLYSNPDNQRAANYFRDQLVDVVLLEEASQSQVNDMQKRLGFLHSYASAVTSESSSEIGIVSRWPLQNVQALPLPGRKVALRDEVDSPLGRRLAIYAVHLAPPFSSGAYTNSQRQFSELARLVQADPLPVVVGGDFNTTTFSPKMRHFVSRLDSKVVPTEPTPWPACSWFGLGWPFCMRIDHVFVPRSVQLRRISLSPDGLGSDHRAVLVEFNFRESVAANGKPAANTAKNKQ